MTDDKKNTELADEKPVKLKGRGGKGNWPSSRAGLIQTDDDRAMVSALIRQTNTLYKQPRVKSDEELMERFAWYFDLCENEGRIPTVEGLALCIGYSWGGMNDIEAGRSGGFSKASSIIIKNAKAFLHEFDAQLAKSGKENPITSIFRMKCYYGLREDTHHTIHIDTNQTDVNADDIAKRYGEDLVEAETASDFAKRLSGANPSDFDAEN